MTSRCGSTVESAVLSTWRQSPNVRLLGRPPLGVPTQPLPPLSSRSTRPEPMTRTARGPLPSSPPSNPVGDTTMSVADCLDRDQTPPCDVGGRRQQSRPASARSAAPTQGDRHATGDVRRLGGMDRSCRSEGRGLEHAMTCPSVWAAGESARRAATGRPWSGWFPNTHPTPSTTHVVSRTPNATHGAGRVLGNRETPLPPARKTRS